MNNLIVDVYGLNQDGSFNGSNTDCYASCCANLINIEPFQLKFIPYGVETLSWLGNNFLGIHIDVSINSFLIYLTTTLQNYGMPVVDISYKVLYTGKLELTVYLSTGQQTTTRI